ncbi:MAG: aminopeptidase N [Bacteriovoracaceae bacterium]
MRFWTLFLTLILSLLLACSSKKQDTEVVIAPTDNIRAAGNYLTETEAIKRKSMVASPEYDIKIHLVPSSNSYTGNVKMKFDFTPMSDDLTIDFYQGKIQNLLVNGIKLTKHSYNNYFLSIPREYLKAGENIVLIEFEKEYSKNGSGFYKFTDPLDHKSYFYTDFEPYNANSFIPLFDQPDLKALYRLTVDAPKDYKVISSTKELEKKDNGDEASWVFRETKSFSTYVFSLHAGPYHEWTDRYKTIPLRLFVRQSLKDFVDYKFWFDITKNGLKYFEGYFNYPYPFLKYDQVIVPDFNSGAMENVGAVTFAEKYVRRGKKSKEEEERLANVILHEMSHMWFGDLVTMKWWNGLWLNESFASFMATKALQEATAFKKAWMTFYDDDKNWAYFEDDLSTSHPIETQVANTDDAYNNFDGITYGKGASVLKQLNFYLGDEAFKTGMQKYFKTYEYGNTTLQNFLGTLAESSGKNLNIWSDLWLKSTGFDRVGHTLLCENNKIKSFYIEEQVVQARDENRFHATKIGLYYLNKEGKLVLNNQFDVTYQLKSKVDEVENLLCPDLVWLNQDDHDYVRVVLDEKSLFTVKNSLKDLSDPLTRSQIWTTLWDMVRDAKMKVSDYLVIVKKHLPSETELKVKLKVLESIPDSLFYLKDKGKEAHWFEDYLTQSFTKAKSDDEKKLYFDQLLAIGRSSQTQKFWLRSLSSKDTLFDQDRRWEILIALSRSGYMDYLGLLDAELKRDKSEKGKKNFLAAQVSFPQKEVKGKWLNSIFETNAHTLAEKKTILKFLFPATQIEIKDSLLHRAYELIPKVIASEENEFIETFARRFAPLTCEKYPHNNLVGFLAKQSEIHSVLKKQLQMNLDEDSRCLNIRAHL